MIKILIISHTFANKELWKRWKLLTDLYHDIEVTLLAPKKWVDGKKSDYSFGSKVTSHGLNFNSERFKVKVIDMIDIPKMGWLSLSLPNVLYKGEYNYIYHIGTHLQDSLLEVLILRKVMRLNVKVLLFSMRGPQHCLSENKEGNLLQQINHRYMKFKLNFSKKEIDGVFCHYPEAKELFVQEGYTAPIFVQTQVGVDSSIYYNCIESRNKIRDMYSIGDSFLFGSASRLSEAKGVTDILKALPRNGDWKYLMMGSGNKDEEDQITSLIKRLGIQDKVIMTGLIDSSEMNEYWNAVDCALHLPKTTNSWVETFSLALVQAMATGLCVIGNDSGSVPYQIGSDGIIIEEGNLTKLNEMLVWAMKNPIQVKEIGKVMRHRAKMAFDIHNLTHCFNSAIRSFEDNQFTSKNMDMVEFGKEGL